MIGKRGSGNVSGGEMGFFNTGTHTKPAQLRHGEYPGLGNPVRGKRRCWWTCFDIKGACGATPYILISEGSISQEEHLARVEAWTDILRAAGEWEGP